MDADSTPPPPASPARLVARRATDLLAISILAVCGLSAGRQISDWWRSESSPASLPATFAAEPLEWSRRELALRFGESSTQVRRIPFEGPRDAAQQELIRLARATLEQSAAPPTGPVSDEEAAWLAALSRQTPEESQPELGAIYATPGFLPSVAVTRPASALGESEARLVAWGLALPGGESAWTLLWFQPSGTWGSSGRDVLPDEAESLLAWRDRSGNEVISFRGTGELEAWLDRFSRRLRSARSEVRRVDATRALERWRSTGRIVEVQLDRDGTEITGLVWITTVDDNEIE